MDEKLRQALVACSELKEKLNDISYVADGELSRITTPRLERLQKFSQIVRRNLTDRNVLGSDLCDLSLKLEEDVRFLADISANIDDMFAILREHLMLQANVKRYLTEIQDSLVNLLLGTLDVCQIYKVKNLDSWIREDSTVEEICSCLKCELIDPQNGDSYDPLTMCAEQSEFTDIEEFDGTICSCIVPGIKIKRWQDGEVRIIRKALVSTYVSKMEI